MTAGGNEDGFRRAYLNQWVSVGGEGAFDSALWDSLIDTSPAVPVRGSVAFGVASAADRSYAAICAAWRRPDGNVQLLVGDDYREGVAWLPARVAELKARYGGQVLVDAPSRALNLPGAIEPSAGDQGKAHNELADAVAAATLRHGNEGSLTESVRRSMWRDSGDTRLLDRRKATSDISPLIAAALAVHGLTTKKSTGGWVMSL